ncbi:MAG: carboxylating nicotinate-nucleotide diphosphorylase [Chloroflexi bacterium]|nr:carboxylating nicotinate-nucleotide diphosphorylase [Chloroflexota bacterium]
MNTQNVFLRQVDKIIEQALAEDLGQGDVTTDSLIPPELIGTASIVVKARGVLAGIETAARVFIKVDKKLKVKVLIKDSSKVNNGDVVATIDGSVASILKAERVALNFIQHLSGIATETSKYIQAVDGLKVDIMETRKTTPGIRLLEKYAVRMGGGRNHRFNLGDGVLIKDNHIAALASMGVGLTDVVKSAQLHAPLQMKIEVEVESMDQAQQAMAGGADILLLDNMSIDEMRRVVANTRDGVLLEASGGINLDTVLTIAETGVNRLSVGALTHSAKALDISLDLRPGTLEPALYYANKK